MVFTSILEGCLKFVIYQYMGNITIRTSTQNVHFKLYAYLLKLGHVTNKNIFSECGSYWSTKCTSIHPHTTHTALVLGFSGKPSRRRFIINIFEFGNNILNAVVDAIMIIAFY